MAPVSRRDFLRYALVGAAAFAGGAAASRYVPIAPSAREKHTHKLAITEALVEMVDHTPVYHWVFEDLAQLKAAPQFPGPLLQATEGDEIELSVANNLRAMHGFRIPGVPGEAGAGVTISPGQTRVLNFTAPAGGSYLYYDHLNAPVNRVMGLHGPMVILPAHGNTPYSHPTANIQKLFDHLGKAAHFPGEPWKPERSRIWLFSTIDPLMNELVREGRTIDPADFTRNYVPRYFTINGESGAYSAHNHHTLPEGRIGQPHLIRIMDAGMSADSPHIHGNHVYLLSRRSAAGELHLQDNVFLVDTFTDEVSQCMDWLLPFIRPPDIPGDERIPLRELLKEELALTLGGVSQSPITFPMHGHNEQSQSAAGGNYPQGLVTGWAITGDVDGIDFPAARSAESGGPPEAH